MRPFAFFLLLALSLTAVAEDEGVDTATRVRALVEQLGSDAWETRDRAFRELESLGSVAVPHLEAVVVEDPEVQRAIERLLAGVEGALERQLERGLRQPHGSFRDSLARRRLVARGAVAVPIVIDAIAREVAVGGTSRGGYDYPMLQNAFDVLRELATADHVDALFGLLDSDVVHVRMLGAVVFRKILGDGYAEEMEKRFLRKSPARVRANVLALLATTERERVARLLPDASEDEAWEVRHAAAELMQRRRDPVDRPLLLRAVRDPIADVRAVAVQALANFADERDARLALLGALDDADARVRQRALQGLTRVMRMGGDRSALPLVRARLDDDDPAVIQSAASLLGGIRDRDSVPRLIALLDREDEGFRTYAFATVVVALGSIRDARAADALVALLEKPSDGDPRARGWRPVVVQSLLRVAGARGIPYAKQLFEDDPQRARSLLITALGDVRDPAVVPLLVDALEDGRSFVVANAAMALGRRRAEGVGSRLAKLLDESEDAYLRQSLLNALRDLADPATGEPILAFLASEVGGEGMNEPRNSYHVRLAIEALGAIRHRPAVPLLGKLLLASPRQRSLCADALGRIGDPAGRTALVTSLAAEASDANRRAVATALAALGDRKELERIHAEDVEAIDGEPQDDRARLESAAIVAVRLGRVERAIAWARRAAEADPDRAMGHYNHACVLALAGEADSALDALERAVERGFRNAMQIERDEDLASLRGLARYRKLIDGMR